MNSKIKIVNTALNVLLVAAGPRACGKTTVLAICKKALEAEGYKVGYAAMGQDTESCIVSMAIVSKDEQIEWHRQEIARLSAELGII